MSTMTMGVRTFYRHSRAERSQFYYWLHDAVGPLADSTVAVTLVDEGGTIDVAVQPTELDADGDLVPTVTTRHSADVPPPWFEVGP